MPVRYSAPALREMSSIYRYIANDNPRAAADVAAAIEVAIDLLRHYSRKSRKTDRRSLRALPLSQYPYIIFYRIRSGELLIVHVLHGARRHPGFSEEAAAFIC